ncbi:MAG: ABC transporter ATP-binding protein [Planctomycetes bacterium]|nr:ABC transporter ATP-binding protein [Planctomycetota bacterium]
MDYAIETQGLTKVYRNGTRALGGVDLQVPRGVCFGLLGPNGAGKSTLIKALLGIIRVSAGTATINGIDFKSPQAREGVGYLPEGHAFPPYLTGRGVCRYYGQLSGLRGPALEREIAEKLEWVGMADRADEKVTKFSKGMKQRVGLAQALLGSPRVVFLDEPTDGLDPIGRAQVRDVIRNITSAGTTVFFNSHLLSEVEQVCSELAILNEGEVLHRGKTGQLVEEMGSEETGVLVEFTTGSVPDELWTTLAERDATRLSDGFSLALNDREEIPDLVDELRAASVPIYAIRPQEKTLEDAFIQLLRSAEPTPDAPEVPA